MQRAAARDGDRRHVGGGGHSVSGLGGGGLGGGDGDDVFLLEVVGQRRVVVLGRAVGVGGGGVEAGDLFGPIAQAVAVHVHVLHGDPVEQARGGRVGRGRGECAWQTGAVKSRDVRHGRPTGGVGHIRVRLEDVLLARHGRKRERRPVAATGGRRRGDRQGGRRVEWVGARRQLGAVADAVAVVVAREPGGVVDLGVGDVVEHFPHGLIDRVVNVRAGRAHRPGKHGDQQQQGQHRPEARANTRGLVRFAAHKLKGAVCGTDQRIRRNAGPCCGDEQAFLGRTLLSRPRQTEGGMKRLPETVNTVYQIRVRHGVVAGGSATFFSKAYSVLVRRMIAGCGPKLLRLLGTIARRPQRQVLAFSKMRKRLYQF